jgi:hypothetical protein
MPYSNRIQKRKQIVIFMRQQHENEDRAFSTIIFVGNKFSLSFFSRFSRFENTIVTKSVTHDTCGIPYVRWNIILFIHAKIKEERR